MTLIERLRALARGEHDDLSIGDEAADALEALEAAERERDQNIEWCGQATVRAERADDLAEKMERERDAALADSVRLREALEDIGVYGCGMLNQPAAMNGPEEAWLHRRILAYEKRAHRALAGEYDNG